MYRATYWYEYKDICKSNLLNKLEWTKEEEKEEIPDILNKETVKVIIYKFFYDCGGPLPDYDDIIKLVGAIRKGKNINHFGISRYSDKTIKVNRILNSPSIKMYPIIGIQWAINF